MYRQKSRREFDRDFEPSNEKECYEILIEALEDNASVIPIADEIASMCPDLDRATLR